MIRTCRGCGCDDNHACVTEEGPCSWVLLDVGQPTGICSACAHESGWHPIALVTMGLGEDEAGHAALEFCSIAPALMERAVAMFQAAMTAEDAA